MVKETNAYLILEILNLPPLTIKHAWMRKCLPLPSTNTHTHTHTHSHTHTQTHTHQGSEKVTICNPSKAKLCPRHHDLSRLSSKMPQQKVYNFFAKIIYGPARFNYNSDLLSFIKLVASLARVIRKEGVEVSWTKSVLAQVGKVRDVQLILCMPWIFFFAV